MKNDGMKCIGSINLAMFGSEERLKKIRIQRDVSGTLMLDSRMCAVFESEKGCIDAYAKDE